MTQTTGETLFAFFNIVAILISLNMLIAMMSNSFQQIAVSIKNIFKNKKITEVKASARVQADNLFHLSPRGGRGFTHMAVYYVMIRLTS